MASRGGRSVDPISDQNIPLLDRLTSQVDDAVILIPPLAEQKRIVAKVDELMKLCDALEDALRRAEDTAKSLADALVAELLA